MNKSLLLVLTILLCGCSYHVSLSEIGDTPDEKNLLVHQQLGLPGLLSLQVGLNNPARTQAGATLAFRSPFYSQYAELNAGRAHHTSAPSPLFKQRATRPMSQAPAHRSLQQTLSNFAQLNTLAPAMQRAMQHQLKKSRQTLSPAYQQPTLPFVHSLSPPPLQPY